MQISSEFIWKRNSRPVNEDSLCICHVLFNNKPLLMAAICDGVGGLPDGESASSYIIANLKNTFSSIPRNKHISFNQLSHLFSRCIFSCHEDLTNGASTLCMVIIYQRKCLLISSGDSRCYYGLNKMKVISKDHIDCRGRLTQAIGAGIYCKPYKKFFHISYKSTILLCSDGFYRHNNAIIMQKNCFKTCFDGEKWKNTMENMYSYAVNQGEKDNSSAIAIWFSK